jgi:hypothetical protein
MMVKINKFKIIISFYFECYFMEDKVLTSERFFFNSWKLHLFIQDINMEERFIDLIRKQADVFHSKYVVNIVQSIIDQSNAASLKGVYIFSYIMELEKDLHASTVTCIKRQLIGDGINLMVSSAEEGSTKIRLMCTISFSNESPLSKKADLFNTPFCAVFRDAILKAANHLSAFGQYRLVVNLTMRSIEHLGRLITEMLCDQGLEVYKMAVDGNMFLVVDWSETTERDFISYNEMIDFEVLQTHFKTEKIDRFPFHLFSKSKNL